MRNKLFNTVLIIVMTTLFLVNCKKDPQEILFKSNYVSGPQPVITAVSPDSAFAGIGEITITGNNFIADAEKNWVYFDKDAATVVSATTTQLNIIAPTVVSDTAKLKVAAYGADLFSEPLDYKLMAAVESMFDFKPAEAPQKMTCDNNGNIYFYLLASGSLDDSVYVYNYLTKEMKKFAPAEKQYDVMRIGPTNQLYALHGTRKYIYQYPEGGGDWERFKTGGKIYDFDFGPEQNIWGAGKDGDNIVRILISDKSTLEIDFTGEVSAVKVFDGDLYLAARNTTDGTHKIYKRKILSSESLGAAEEYFDLGQLFDMTSIADDKVVGMSFSQDGHLYLTCVEDPNAPKSPALYVITPGGASFEPLYPVLFSNDRKNNFLTWGVYGGTNLFVCRSEIVDAAGETLEAAVILRVNTLKPGAAENGRGDI